MTLQVALAARDGFVLASDKKAISGGGRFRTLPTDGKVHIRRSSTITKILVGTNQSLVCAFSGDDLSLAVARRLIGSCPGGFDADAQVITYLVETSRESIPEGTNPENQQIIAAIPNAKGVSRIWRLYLGAAPVAVGIEDKVFGGDESNTAVYIPETFYKKSQAVEDLKLLAAHFILEGQRFSSSVAGLDVFVSKDGGEHRFLDDDEKRDLESRSRAIHEMLQRMIFPVAP